jgi:regulator of RNase E activity RraB
MDWQKLQFWRKPSEAPPKLDYEVIAEYEAADTGEGDRLVVEALVNAGADLSQSREVLHYFYFSDKKTASSVVTELRQEGFEVEAPLQIAPVEEARNPWRVLATVETVVNLGMAQASTRRFRSLAAQHGGEYDGWEAAAKP